MEIPPQVKSLKRSIKSACVANLRYSPYSQHDSSKKTTKPPLSTKSFQPAFLSHEDLLSANLDVHVDRLLASLNEKSKFVHFLRTNFVLNPQIDCQLYKSNSFSPFLENQFVIPVMPFSLDEIEGYRIAAVDGGLGFRQYLGLQVTLIKAAVVQYHFLSQSPPKITVYPPTHQPRNYCLYTDYAPATEFHGGLLAGYRRQIAENSLLIEFIQSNVVSPELIILDGSILPPPCPVSAKEDELTFKYYSRCFESYNELYTLCQSRGILLIGCIKDTRSTVLRDLLLKAFPFFIGKHNSLQPLTEFDYRRIMLSFTDVELVARLLASNTRSLAFRYDFQDYIKYHSAFTPNFTPETKAFRENAIENGDNEKIEDLFSLLKPKEGIFASYLQITTMDSPVRVEFISPISPEHVQRRIDTIAKVIYPISRITPQCTLPIPQIEAHMLAHLPETEMDLVMSQLQRRLCLKQFSHFGSQAYQQYAINDDFSTQSSFEGRNPILDHFQTFSEKRHSRLPF